MLAQVLLVVGPQGNEDHCRAPGELVAPRFDSPNGGYWLTDVRRPGTHTVLPQGRPAGDPVLIYVVPGAPPLEARFSCSNRCARRACGPQERSS
jgi:hypothetical protein